MTTDIEGPRAPGWHPDPDDATVLRHWDGQAWGAERRPRPSWAGGDGAGAGPTEPPAPAKKSRRWWLLAGGATTLALLLALVGSNLSRGPKIPPRTVEDRTYTRRANAACLRELPELRNARPQLGDKPKDDAEVVAAKVENTADGLEKLVAELRALPAATGAGDAARIDRWLDDWDAFIASGRRYTAALRRGDPDAPADVARVADPLTRRVFLFSKSNGMPDCLL